MRRETTGTDKLRREAWGGTSPADPSVLHFQPPELWENRGCCLSRSHWGGARPPRQGLRGGTPLTASPPLAQGAHVLHVAQRSSGQLVCVLLANQTPRCSSHGTTGDHVPADTMRREGHSNVAMEFFFSVSKKSIPEETSDRPKMVCSLPKKTSRPQKTSEGRGTSTDRRKLRRRGSQVRPVTLGWT